MLERPQPRKPPPPPADRRRAWRQREYRARQANGSIVVGVELDGEVVNRLIAWGWLQSDEADDKRKIGAALARMLADAARHR